MKKGEYRSRRKIRILAWDVLLGSPSAFGLAPMTGHAKTILCFCRKLNFIRKSILVYKEKTFKTVCTHTFHPYARSKSKRKLFLLFVLNIYFYQEIFQLLKYTTFNRFMSSVENDILVGRKLTSLNYKLSVKVILLQESPLLSVELKRLTRLNSSG